MIRRTAKYSYVSALSGLFFYEVYSLSQNIPSNIDDAIWAITSKPEEGITSLIVGAIVGGVAGTISALIERPYKGPEKVGEFYIVPDMDKFS